VIDLMDGAARDAGVDVTLAGRAAVGAGSIRIDGDPAARAVVIARLRDRADAIGHVVVAHAGRGLKDLADVWGPPSPSLVIARALKRALDPAGVLNAGRGPI
jgi:hypothetical protein